MLLKDYNCKIETRENPKTGKVDIFLDIPVSANKVSEETRKKMKEEVNDIIKLAKNAKLVAELFNNHLKVTGGNPDFTLTTDEILKTLSDGTVKTFDVDGETFQTDFWDLFVFPLNAYQFFVYEYETYKDDLRKVA